MELNERSISSLNDSSRPPMTCCVRLACKSMSYRDDERPGRLHISDTQTYWCTITMDPVGPDDGHTNPKLCQPGRACFRAEE